MKRVDMMTQLINTGAKQKVTDRQDGSHSSESTDFEKMLEQAGQQQGFTAGETSEGVSSSTSAPVAVSGEKEPGVEQMAIAAALVTVQPMVPVEPIQQVEVADIVPAGTAVVTDVAQAAPVLVQEATAEPMTAEPMTPVHQDNQQAMTEAVPEEILTREPAMDQPVQRAAEDAQPQAEQQKDAPVETREHTEVRADTSEQPVVEDASAAAEAPVFERMETVPVKVAETSGEPVAPEADDAAAQISRQIEQAMAQGQSKVQITLTPANLGQLTVEIMRSGDGDLSIVLTTVTGKAAQLLDRHVDGLQHMLTSTQNVHVEIETRTQEPQAQQFLNPDGQNNHHHQQQHQQKKEEQPSDGDFLQQLRLGLVGLD